MPDSHELQPDQRPTPATTQFDINQRRVAGFLEKRATQEGKSVEAVIDEYGKVPQFEAGPHRAVFP